MRGLALLAAAAALAETPDRVLVIANRNSAASMEIASYYAAKRKIPAANLCVIESTSEEAVAREVYEKQVEAPVSRCLDRGGLAERIHYLVTTLHVPLHITGPAGRQSPAASVDSELTLLYLRRKGARPPLEGPYPNPFYRQRDTPFGHRLFPVYLVTRLAAYDVETVKRMIGRGLEGRNRGKVILDMRDGSDRDGEAWLRNAMIFLPPGRAVLEETGGVVYGAKEVIGYGSWGSNDKRRLRRRLGFSWLPGAIANEFVSTNGRSFRRPPEEWTPGMYWAGSNQSMTADLIEEGATGASGHTAEPYLSFCPRPDLLFPAYLGGRNLAESYYLAMPALSWMNIVVGDPLVRLAP